jgi:hypothetical protein
MSALDEARAEVWRLKIANEAAAKAAFELHATLHGRYERLCMLIEELERVALDQHEPCLASTAVMERIRELKRLAGS